MPGSHSAALHAGYALRAIRSEKAAPLRDHAVWSGLGGDIRERLKGEDVFGGLGEMLASFYVI